MATNFPERHRAHQLARESERFFHRHLPHAWTYDAPTNDYGVDLRVGIVTEGQIRGRTFVVQLKASATANQGESVPVRLAVSTYNYLWNMLEVALLVKYVASENEAYWLLWKDIAAPPQEQETVTVRIPRINRLSQNPWPQIERYVGLVHDQKLGVMRR